MGLSPYSSSPPATGAQNPWFPIKRVAARVTAAQTYGLGGVCQGLRASRECGAGGPSKSRFEFFIAQINIISWSTNLGRVPPSLEGVWCNKAIIALPVYAPCSFIRFCNSRNDSGSLAALDTFCLTTPDCCCCVSRTAAAAAAAVLSVLLSVLSSSLLSSTSNRREKLEKMPPGLFDLPIVPASLLL